MTFSLSKRLTIKLTFKRIDKLMTARIETDFNFLAGLHFENAFYVNAYDMTLSMLVETDSIHEQNVAMDRAEHFLKKIIQNSILVESSLTEEIEKYRTAGLTVCQLPEEPFDQILAMVLLLKLNAIMENRLKITDLVIGSAMSGGVRFSIVAESAENLLDGNYWWNSPCLAINNINETGIDRSKVIRLFNNDEWVNLGLAFR